MTRQIALDTETTGISPSQGHRIIEVAGVEIINRQLTGNHFHCYINPERLIDEGAKRVHGITEEFLADKPTFDKIVDEFIEYIKGAELIIHNAPFDVGFLNHEFQLLKRNTPKVESICDITDTLAMARKMHIGQRNSLDALCKRYEVDNSNRELHGALLDSELLADVYLAMTGGQNSLFGDTTQETTTATAKAQFKHSGAKLNVIPANPEELAAHLEYLKKMKENGECFWLEGETEEA